MPTVPIPLLLVAGLAGGAVAGVGLERAGVLSPLDEPEPSAAATIELDRVPVLDCPDGAVVASLARGDRVVATGTTADGDWVEIRSPLALEQPAWMAAGSLTGDRSLDDLPTSECRRVPPTTSTTTTSSTTTTTSSTTTTTRPVTTTLPDTPPVVRDVAASPNLIVTGGPNTPTVCSVPPGMPTTSEVSVTAIDERRGVTVAMTYETISGGQVISSGGLTMQPPQGSLFTGVLGPLPPTSAPAVGPPTIARVTIRATDSAGQQVSASVDVEVIRCQQ